MEVSPKKKKIFVYTFIKKIQVHIDAKYFLKVNKNNKLYLGDVMGLGK